MSVTCTSMFVYSQLQPWEEVGRWGSGLVCHTQGSHMGITTPPPPHMRWEVWGSGTAKLDSMRILPGRDMGLWTHGSKLGVHRGRGTKMNQDKISLLDKTHPGKDMVGQLDKGGRSSQLDKGWIQPGKVMGCSQLDKE